jgi:subtilase family serine protease
VSILLLFSLSSSTIAVADDATLSWNPNSETDLAGYKVYYGTASRLYGPPIPVGNQTTYTVTGLCGGTYYFSVTAYNTSGSESGYSNEVSKTFTTACSTTTTTKPRPDLIITQEEPNAPSVNAGAALSVSDTVSNQGTANANSFRIYYHLSGDTLFGGADDKILLPARLVSSPLGPGASNASAGFSLKIPLTIAAGTYHVCAKIYAVIPPESNPNNNTLCSTTTVTVPLPDLIISALSTTTTSAKVGSIIRVSLSVTNQGGSRSKLLSKVELHASTNTILGDGDDLPSLYRATTTLLSPGQTQTLASWPVKMPPTPGTYYICAKTDADGVISESNETNNTLCTTTTITLHP